MIDDRLLYALDTLRIASIAAGVDVSDAFDEAAAIAAAVCGSDPESAEHWSKVFTRRASGFIPAAEVGAPLLDNATPILKRLLMFGDESSARRFAKAMASVAVEACVLDPDPGIETVTAAERASGAQLRAVGEPTAAPAVPADVKAEAEADAEATAAAEPAEPPKSMAELLAELDELIGLDEVKQQVKRQTQLLRINKLRAEKDLKVPTITQHLVFVGNPGTGKTTVARLVAGIYRAIGMLEKGELIETDRAGLVAGYLGQTAMKTAKVIDSALGSILFIDEAYSLAQDDFGEEAVSTLVKGMEDHRDELVVIVAGYPHDMATFIATNPGLESRFATTIVFPDYTDDELVAIFKQLAKKNDFSPTDGCITRLREILAATERGQGFGNGRFVRNLFEGAVSHHAWRLRDKENPSIAELRQLKADDIPDSLIL